MFKRIGGWNYIGIILIAGFMGFLSILSLLSQREMERIRAEWWDNFLSRQLAFTLFSLALLAVLLLFNIIHDLIAYHNFRWRKLLDILWFGWSICFAITLLGNLFFMSA